MATFEPAPQDHQRGGLLLALGAYLIWGLIPIYFHALASVPAVELVAWRVLFTLPFCLVVAIWRRELAAIVAALARPRLLATLSLSAALIAINWLVYVYAIVEGHLFAASLGYYINPLVNVLFGTLFLGERLTRTQWLAVVLAAVGVTVLAWGAHEMLAISLALALSFGSYGLVRKLAPVEALPGLTVETIVLFPLAAGWIAWAAVAPSGVAIGSDPATDAMLVASGVITGLPLLLFAAAARRLPYSTLGFVQYLAPTIVFVLGLVVFREPLRTVQLASFVLIWSAIAVFSLDALARHRRPAALEPAPDL